MKRAALPVVVLLAAVAGATIVARPRVTPRLSGGVANSVTSFWRDHPEWEALRENRRDATPILLNHARHMDPNAPGMQEHLARLIASPRAQVQRLPDGRLSMSCASCHTPDRAGRSMEPIRFDNHCAACHADDLGRIDVAPGVVASERAPHGSVEAVALRVESRLNEWVLRARFEREDATEPADGSTTRRRRSAAESAPDRVPPFEDESAMRDWIIERRARMLRRVQSSCEKCHAGIVEPNEGYAGAHFTVEPPRIPSVWLPRAVFSHRSHTMLSCTACHAQAMSSVSTQDIMLPGIASCRECHSPRAGAPSDCVMCHVYHERTDSLLGGGELTIPDFIDPHRAR